MLTEPEGMRTELVAKPDGTREEEGNGVELAVGMIVWVEVGSESSPSSVAVVWWW
jgi:hypothetical protein